MNRIQPLPESVIRMIAAGEVIERPASVVKELVENSLDAGATRISASLWSAGRTGIRVSDNGEGMSPEDAAQALERHATSKLRGIEDLESIRTLGFRGEALPSIASVSDLTLTTRKKGVWEKGDSPSYESGTVPLFPDSGWEIRVQGGKVLSAHPAGGSPGTTVDVQKLFFNTPVRAKFLKRDLTEKHRCLRMLQELALAYPSVAFRIEVDGETVADWPSGQLSERLRDVLGPETWEKLIPFQMEGEGLSVRGYGSAIPHHGATKSVQYLFVNRRPIQHRLLMHALYEAYHEWLPVGRHPLFVLFLEVDPSEVDVNIHPTKREVRFAKEREIYDRLFHRLRETVRHSQEAVPLLPLSGATEQSVIARREATKQSPATAINREIASLPMIARNDGQGDPVLRVERFKAVSDSTVALEHDVQRAFTPLAQFKKLYLVAEEGDDLLIVDQHAAAERVLYERLLKNVSQGTPAVQVLLLPETWTLSPDQAALLRQSLPALQQLGFDLEEFGRNTFRVKGLPATLHKIRNAATFLEHFLSALSEERTPEGPHHEVVARAACRAAIKANDALAPEEMARLAADLATCERPMTCPHGRPTHIRLPLAELHRRFRRT